MLLRQLFDPASSSFTYLVADPAQGCALLIDPVLEQVERDLQLLAELQLQLRYVLETHTHADHLTAAGLLQDRTGAELVAGHGAGAAYGLQLGDGDRLSLGALEVRVLSTPGHTDDSVSYTIGDCVFTGDALLVRGAGRTDFQNGSAAQLYATIVQGLFRLDAATRVFPGHDYRGFTMSTIGEEMRHNARIAGRSLEGFVALMAGLDLPPPRRLAEAVPANRRAGRPE